MTPAQNTANKSPRTKAEPDLSQALTVFTDSEAALEEAHYLAEQTGWPQAIVNGEQGMTVMAKHRAWGMEILEVVHG